MSTTLLPNGVSLSSRGFSEKISFRKRLLFKVEQDRFSGKTTLGTPVVGARSLFGDYPTLFGALWGLSNPLWGLSNSLWGLSNSTRTRCRVKKGLASQRVFMEKQIIMFWTFALSFQGGLRKPQNLLFMQPEGKHHFAETKLKSWETARQMR